jgi:hypothetical protein
MAHAAALVGAIAAAGNAQALEPQDLPFFGQYYGNALMGHNASNLQAKLSTEQALAYAFYAERTGVIERIRWHARYGAGYGLGNGGVYTIELRAADPNTFAPLTGVAPICSVSNIIPNPSFPSAIVGSGKFDMDNVFSTQGEITAGQPYCVIWRNTHANPPGNFVSCNSSLYHAFDDPTDPPDYAEPAGASPTNPGSSPGPVSGWIPVILQGKFWYPFPVATENGVRNYRRLGSTYMELQYDDGIWLGGGTWGGDNSYRAQIGNPTSNMVRERFRVTRADRTVSGVYIRIPRYNGTTGNLVVTLEQGGADTSGNGTTLEEVVVPHTAIYDVGSMEDINWTNGDPAEFDLPPFLWVPFAENHTLSRGTIYNLRLSTTGALDCRMRCTSRSDQQWGPAGSSLTWDEWDGGSPYPGPAAQRDLPWTAWEDSRGFMVSTNSGSSWSFFVGRMSPILFRS